MPPVRPHAFAVLLVASSSAVAQRSHVELSLSPADATVTLPAGGAPPNVLLGTSGAVDWRFHEHFGLGLLGGGTWYSRNGEQLSRLDLGYDYHLQPAWFAMAGASWLLEASSNLSAHFALHGGVLGAAVALTPSRVLPTGPDLGQVAPAGLEAAGRLTAALRLRLTPWLALQFDVRVTLFGSAGPLRLAGCGAEDLRAGAATRPHRGLGRGRRRLRPDVVAGLGPRPTAPAHGPGGARTNA